MRPSRGERTTTSCGECRRRKQKCNQGQPCSNCSRRFPPPSCEYHGGPRRQHSPGHTSSQPMTMTSLSNLRHRCFEPEDLCPASLSPTLPLPSQWSESSPPISNEVVRWSGIELVTRSPALTNTLPSYFVQDHVPLSQPSSTLDVFHRPTPNNASDTVFGGGQGSSTRLHGNPGIFDNFLLTAWVSNEFTDEATEWFTMGATGHDLAYATRSFDVGSTDGQAEGLSPMGWLASPQEDGELLSIFVRTLAPFHAALDGVAVPSHPYLKHHVPFIMQSPLLRQTSIYTSAGFLHDQGHMDKATMLSYKVKAISLFNSHVSAGIGPNDEIIAAHIQLTLIEWYWSDSGELGPHLRALREMIRSRDGLQSLGPHCLIAKMAVTLDACISLTAWASPILRLLSSSTQSPSRGAARLSFNTPFVLSFPSFGSCVESMDLDPVTAKVLDEVRFLINAVLSLPKQATEMEVAKIKVTGSYVYQCILRLGNRSAGQMQAPPTVPSYSYPTTHRQKHTHGPMITEWMPSAVTTVEGCLHPGTTVATGRRPGVQRSTSSPNVTLPYATISARASSEQQAPQGSGSPPLNPASLSAQQPIADSIFPAVRLAALIYARAITHRQPFHSCVTGEDFTSLWQAFWRVPLSRWKEVLGVCNWILVPFLPVARNSKQGRVVKNLVFNGLFTMGVEDGEIATKVMERMERLRAWLAGGGPG